MILVDANLLIYAAVSAAPEHRAASRWLEDRLNGTMRVGLPWPSLLAFLRVVTNPRFYSRPVRIAMAWDQVETWLNCPVVWIPQPTERHPDVLKPLLDSVSGPNLVPDAHLAALAIEHGLTVCSTDGDFARFAGLRWENPLA